MYIHIKDVVWGCAETLNEGGGWFLWRCWCSCIKASYLRSSQMCLRPTMVHSPLSQKLSGLHQFSLCCHPLCVAHCYQAHKGWPLHQQGFCHSAEGHCLLVQDLCVPILWQRNVHLPDLRKQAKSNTLLGLQTPQLHFAQSLEKTHFCLDHLWRQEP